MVALEIKIRSQLIRKPIREGLRRESRMLSLLYGILSQRVRKNRLGNELNRWDSAGAHAGER